MPDASLSGNATRSLPTLSMSPLGFKVMVVSDTHLLDGQGSQAIENITRVNALSTNALTRYIELEQPDFVIHNGDLVSGESANSTQDVRKAVHQLLGPLIKARVPFASTKGNHDNDKYSTHASLTDLEWEFGQNLAYSQKTGTSVKDGDSIGSDNYWIPIYSSGNVSPTTKPTFLLWFFDSRSGKTMLNQSPNGTQQSIPDWVDASVATWYKQQVTHMQAKWNSLPPSLVFVHIPPHESAITQQGQVYGPKYVGGVLDETPGNFTTLNKTYPGLNDDFGFGGQGAEDDTQPNGGYTGQDRAFLDALTNPVPALSLGRIHAIVSGHQHGLDWVAPSSLKTQSQSTVPVCFAKHSGFGGYDYDNWNHGVRVFHIDEDNANKGITTWIRFLTGEKRYETVLDEAFAKRITNSTVKS